MAHFPGVPVLAGQHPQYIISQLERFSAGDDGTKSIHLNAIMAHKGKFLPQSEWKNVSKALSEQECVNHGNPDLPIMKDTPCASCHGPRGISDTPDIPNLAGQDVRYMYRQYQKFREPYIISFGVTMTQNMTRRLHPVSGYGIPLP